MKKAQGATELIIILALALAILLTIFAVNTDIMGDVNNRFRYSKARAAVDDMGDAAELVYQQGIGSKTRVYIALPNSVDNVTISGKTIAISFEGTDEVVYRNLGFNVNGSLPRYEGFYWINIESMDGYVLINASFAFNESFGGVVCGNNVKETGEVCDGSDLSPYTSDCSSYPGFTGGILSCYGDCNGFNTSLCTAVDTTPPASVTNLRNISAGTTWIYWNWTNPSDIDFSQAIIYINGNNLINTTNNYYNATGLSENTNYTITVHTKDTSGNVNNIDVNSTATTLYEPDIKPPASITNLLSQSQGTTWIYWNWTNPIDLDFYQAIIYIDGNNVLNTSNNYYNATGLSENTNYTITVHTKDTSGNVNDTDVNDTAKTMYIFPDKLLVFGNLTSSNIHYSEYKEGAWSAISSIPYTQNSRIMYVVVKEAPTRDEYIVVTVDLNNDVYARVFSGGTWHDERLISLNANSVYRGFDVVYETNSGDALVVANQGNDDFIYYIWDGSSWNGPNTYATVVGGQPYWINLERNPLSSSNEIAMISLFSGLVVYGAIWDGSSFGNPQTLSSAVDIATEEAVGLAYEQQSGGAMFVWSDATDTINYRQWLGSSWASASSFSMPNMDNIVNWMMLASNPNSDELMLGVLDDAQDVNTREWSGSSWSSAHTEITAGTETDAARSFDLTYETDTGNSGNVLLTYAPSNADQIMVREYRGSTTWTSLPNYDPYAASTDKRIIQMVSSNGITEHLNSDDAFDLHHWYFNELTELWTSSGTALGEIDVNTYNTQEPFMIAVKR